MGRFDTTKATINANIKSNGNQEITGSVLNSVLQEMVDGTDAQLTELSGETDKKFIDVDTEIENLKRGEAYVFGETLAFRNYADAMVQGNTLTL